MVERNRDKGKASGRNRLEVKSNTNHINPQANRKTNKKEACIPMPIVVDQR